MNKKNHTYTLCRNSTKCSMWKKDDQTQKICTATSLHHSYDKRRCEQQNKQKETYIPTMQPMNLLGGKFSSFFFVSMYYIVLKMLSMPADENFSKSINEDTYLLASSKR